MNELKGTSTGKWTLIFALLCALALLLELVIDRHLDLEIEGIFGFYPLYGFVSIVVLILLARILRSLVKREEGYYGD